MGGVEIVCGAVMLLASIAIIILVAMQNSPKSGGISALTGGDSFFNKNKGRTKDAMLSNLTRIFAVAFFVATIVVYAIMSRTLV